MKKQSLIYKLTADNQAPNSLAAKARAKRFRFFLELLDSLGTHSIRILDVGGTQNFWKSMGYLPEGNIEITLINLKKSEVTHPNFISLEGDARDLHQFEDNHFDIVFSNSVIEHLYTWENQMLMAKEIQRLGKHYFVQTPNYGFPVEPHFVFPFFHYLPIPLRVWITKNYDLGHYPRAKNKERAIDRVNEIQLLTVKEMKKLFPEADIYKEKLLGLTKSIIAYKFD